jgi:hypothetical protein
MGDWSARLPQSVEDRHLEDICRCQIPTIGPTNQPDLPSLPQPSKPTDQQSRSGISSQESWSSSCGGRRGGDVVDKAVVGRLERGTKFGLGTLPGLQQI